MQRLSRFLPFLLWGVALGIYALAVMPNAPQISDSDKVEHMLAFFTLATLARIAHPAASSRTIFIILAVFGGAIEITQLIPALHRDCSVYDWIADMAAILIGLFVGDRLLQGLRSVLER